MRGDHSPSPPDVASVATDFTALWRAGEFQAAGEKYWADDVVSIEPHDLPDGNAAMCRGIEAVRAKTLRWLTTHGVEDLSLDGPFITGDRFALFVVRDGRIIEEHHFYD